MKLGITQKVSRIFHPLVHFSNGHNSLLSSWPKPGVRNSIWVAPMAARESLEPSSLPPGVIAEYWVASGTSRTLQCLM